VGLAGQLCWNVENQWFNTFVYAKIAPDPVIINWMVAVSAAVTTLSTFVSGALSDRIGRRRPFIAIGYVLWGAFTIAFGATEFLPRNNFTALAVAVVAADAVMSFFGSFGNDAGFNPWTTDITNEKNRGNLGAVIAVQPVIATILGTVVSGFIIGALDYFGFFIIMGGLMAAVGVFSFFAVKDSPTLRPSKDPKGFGHQFLSSFNFRLVFKDRLLLWVFLIFSAFFISFNVYFSYILNYFIYTLGYDEANAGMIMGIGLVAAIPLTFLAGPQLNKGRFVPVLCAAVALNIVGLLVLLGSGLAAVVIGIIFVGGGYMCVYQTLMIWVKNLYPEDKRGAFEGIRLLFYVLIPMALGTTIASPIIRSLGVEVVNEFGVKGYAPTSPLFAIAAAIAFLTYIPIFFAYREQKRRTTKQQIASPKSDA
jgi:MFS family permease